MSRNTEAISITLPPMMIKQIDETAHKEDLTRSSLFRKAFRQYFARQSQWESLRRYASKQATKLTIKEEDIDRIIHEYRTEI